MPFAPPKPAVWGLEEALTSAQMNALQAAIVAADAAQSAALAAVAALSVVAVSMGPGNVLAATTFLPCCGTYSIPANSFGFTTKYRAQGVYQAARGATATALNLVTRFSLGPTTLSVTSAALSIANPFQGAVYWFAEFALSSTTNCNVSLVTHTNCDNVAPAGKVVSGFSGTFAIDTAIANDVKVEAQMSVAVANTALFGGIGDIERRAS